MLTKSTKRKLNVNYTCMLHAALNKSIPNKTANIRPKISHLINLSKKTNKTLGTQLKKQAVIH